MEIPLNKKIISFILATALLICVAAAICEMAAPAEAQTATSLTVTTADTSINGNNMITLTATISGGSNPETSAITWGTSSSTGSFGTATYTSTTASITYVDTGSVNPITVTITANYPGDANNEPSSATITLTVYNTIDFNQDGKVNFSDVIYFVQAYIAYDGGAGIYNPLIDLVHSTNHVINYNDVVAFVALYENYQGAV